MFTPHTTEDSLHAGIAAGRKSEFNTTSSKMFDTYLTDIEQLLHHQMWSAALNDARRRLPAMPRIFAISNTTLAAEAARLWRSLGSHAAILADSIGASRTR